MEQENFKKSLFEALKSTEKTFQNYNALSGQHLNFREEAKLVFDWVIASQGYDWGRYCDTSIASIQDSLLSSAKTGLTFDPQRGLAFLKCVFDPRIGEFVTRFDFGYKGFLMLAARSGLVKLITADVVYDNDVFKFNGTRKMVTHEVTALSPTKRGHFAGGYCTTELLSDVIITTVMTPEEILTIEYEAKKNQSSAWNSAFVDELRRKTLIRRHWKTLSTTLRGMKSIPALSHVDEMIEDDNELEDSNITSSLNTITNSTNSAQGSY